MENLAFVLIGITLFILVIILGLLTALVFKLLYQKKDFFNPPAPQSQSPESSGDKTNLHPEILGRLKSVEKLKPKRADLFCPNHLEDPGEVTCAICDKLYCRACVKPFKTMHFCKEHLLLIMRHDWEEVLTIKTSTTDPEQGVRLFDVKKNLLEREDIPTYIETHYKINVDQDYIETYLVLFGMKEKTDELKEKLSAFFPA
jgi:hypothetical protein